MLTIAGDPRKGVGLLLVAVDADVTLNVAARLAVSQHIQQRGLQAGSGTAWLRHRVQQAQTLTMLCQETAWAYDMCISAQ